LYVQIHSEAAATLGYLSWPRWDEPTLSPVQAVKAFAGLGAERIRRGESRDATPGRVPTDPAQRAGFCRGRRADRVRGSISVRRVGCLHHVRDSATFTTAPQGPPGFGRASSKALSGFGPHTPTVQDDTSR
jgi:hypothetical protein